MMANLDFSCPFQQELIPYMSYNSKSPKFKNAQKRDTKKQKSDSINNKKMIVQNHIEYCEHLKLS